MVWQLFMSQESKKRNKEKTPAYIRSYVRIKKQGRLPCYKINNTTYAMPNN